MANWKKYRAHASYTLKHKWYVFLECCKRGIPLRGLLHDLSKFTPREFFPYALYFFDENGKKFENIHDKTGAYNPLVGAESFKQAWFWHQHRNKHHWQYWVCPGENRSAEAIKIPRKYVLEMVSDWTGAGKAQGTPDVLKWYQGSKDKMLLHPDTRKEIEELIGFKE